MEKARWYASLFFIAAWLLVASAFAADQPDPGSAMLINQMDPRASVVAVNNSRFGVDAREQMLPPGLIRVAIEVSGYPGGTEVLEGYWYVQAGKTYSLHSDLRADTYRLWLQDDATRTEVVAVNGSYSQSGGGSIDDTHYNALMRKVKCDPATCSERPRFVSGRTPHYPRKAFKKGQSGVVRVLFDVTANGRVVNLRILESTSEDFTESVEKALSDWQFVPAKFNGKPIVFADVPLQIPFDLEGR